VGLFGICSGDAFSWDRQSLLPPLLDLDPTYCQISSPLHISLSELEQVALNFTSLPHQATGAKVLAACATCAGGRRDMRWWPARHALVARRRDVRWWPVRHALVAGATCAGGRGRQLRWRCFDFTATRRQPARAGLGFDFWASSPGFSYCGTTVMVDPARAPGRERSSSVPSWHEIVPAGCYNRRDS